jgi:hypothetical protein
MFNKLIPNNQNLLITILTIFSLAVNQYYGNKGVFPIEGFAFFDTAYRIFHGDVPFKDYWAVSGVFIDYTQFIFFKIFGVNFQAYVLHASIVNCLLTIMTFFYAKNLNISIYFCFFYALIFSLLAYTTSGTLYVDNHASLICLAAIYFFIFGIIQNRKNYFFLVPPLIGIAFFTKPAPTIYIFLFLSIVLLAYVITSKKYQILLNLFYSTAIFLSFIFLFIYLQNIPIELILEQYFYFPVTIANQRYENFTFSFDNVILNFKFIYFFLIPLIVINLKKLVYIKNYFTHDEFSIFFIILGFTICLIFHQLNTKNQLFILFLIPVICILLHSQLMKARIEKKNFLITFFTIACIFFTYKYHIRFNENRKFHEMVNVNFNLAADASKIDKKLTGLKWITPSYSTSPNAEIGLIIDTLKVLKFDSSKKMIISNYSFFSAILEENTYSPSRWFISNGGAYPIEKNKYFSSYKNYLYEIIDKKQIDSIYVIFPVKEEELLRYVNMKCFKKKMMNKIATKFEIIPKCQFKN